MSPELNLLAAFLIGLLGSTHCIGMCGGIMGAISVSASQKCQGGYNRFSLLLLYNIGRIISYGLIGALLGASAQWLSGLTSSVGMILRTLAGILVIAMGFYISGWWFGLKHLERAGHHIWRHLQPLFSRLLPAQQRYNAFFAGMLWGWLPCGLVYSTLAWSAASADALQSAALMIFFGLGTLPALLAMGLFFSQLKDWLQQRWVRRTAGVMLIAFGLWTLPIISQQLMIGSSHNSHTSMSDMELSDETDAMPSMGSMSTDSDSENMPQTEHQH